MSNKLKIRLEESGLTQTDVATALGITRSVLSNCLNGYRNWPPEIKREVELLIENQRSKNQAKDQADVEWLDEYDNPFWDPSSIKD